MPFSRRNNCSYSIVQQSHSAAEQWQPAIAAASFVVQLGVSQPHAVAPHKVVGRHRHPPRALLRAVHKRLRVGNDPFHLRRIHQSLFLYPGEKSPSPVHQSLHILNKVQTLRPKLGMSSPCSNA